MKNRIINSIKPLFGGFMGILMLSLIWYGCEEEGRIDQIDDSAPAPAQVTNVTVRNTPGGAVLKYTLPNDKNLLYVQAIYEIQPGVFHENKSSYFKDSLVLEGFGDVKEYEVKIYTVGKNGKQSEPLTQKVHPTKPPVQLATKSLRETFGGIAVDIVNPEKANLAIVLLADTANQGFLSEVYTFYTSMPNAAFNYRGLDSIPGNFAVYLRDRWNNFSDTVSARLTPWFEEYIVKGSWSDYTLPGDIPPVNSGYPITRIWDEVYTTDGFHGMETQLLPHTLTWNLGEVVKLSRLKYYPRRHGDDRWKRGHARIFEIYGSKNPPNPDGSMDDSWIPLGRFTCVKPSGEGSTITQEDIDFSDNGIDFDFEVSDFAPNPYAEVQYIRWRTVSTYAFASFSTVHIMELSFWGNYVK